MLLTNHHVLPDAQTARRCFLEFNAQVTIDNAPDAAIRFACDPDTFFTPDEHLDYALVAVEPAADGSLAGARFGWNQLSNQQGKLVQNEPVNVIGHPMGRLKEIALRDNALVQRLDDFLHYRTDTEPGNSGSPVFNDQWEVVALHHMGVPNTDTQGRILRKDGQIWRGGVDSDDTIDYVSNEGARTSSILKHLATLPLDPQRRALLAEMGPESGLRQDAAAGPVETPVAPAVAPAPTPQEAAAVAAAPGPAAAGAHTGLRAPEDAFGGRRHLVFLHGRSQQGKDPELLRRGWTGDSTTDSPAPGSPPSTRRTSGSRTTATGSSKSSGSTRRSPPPTPTRPPWRRWRPSPPSPRRGRTSSSSWRRRSWPVCRRTGRRPRRTSAARSSDPSRAP